MDNYCLLLIVFLTALWNGVKRKLVEKQKDGDCQMIENENFTLLHIYNILAVYGFAPLVGITIGCIIVSKGKEH